MLVIWDFTWLLTYLDSFPSICHESTERRRRLKGEVLEPRSASGVYHYYSDLFITNQSYDPTQLKGRLKYLISCLLESTMRFMEPQIFSLPQETFRLINAFICLHL